jgi:assimilatory nitrate reductase catalytic subunit
VPFHFSEQLINSVTIPDFDPKSFEPNFKQCAVNIYSDEVSDGIVMKETEIAGVLEHQRVDTQLTKTIQKETTTRV